MTGGSGTAGATTTGTACAACKYQRRKCSPDCPLSPYFPPDQPKRFANVHKLFGVSNILRLLKHVDPSKREDTVKSIAYEADTREKDPVHGCLGVITVLQNQVAKLKEELQAAREQLFLMEQHAIAQQQLNPFHGHHPHGIAFDDDEDILGPKFDSKMLYFGPNFGPEAAMRSHVKGEQQQQQQARAGSYFGMPEPAYDESPVSHHQMHTLAALDHDPSFHLRSDQGGYGFDMKRGNNNCYLIGGGSSGGGLQQGHELRRAGVYLSLTNQH